MNGAFDVDNLIGANPLDEGADDEAAKFVDIVDTFKLQLWVSI